MFRRSRRKIILSIMGLLILLFAVTLAVILLASFGEIRHKNVEMLERYVADYSLDEVTSKQSKADLPVEKTMGRREPPPINERSDSQLSTFYSVALSDEGKVLAVDNEGKDAYQEEELVQIARKISSQDQRSGRMGNITYIVEAKEGYTLVAFMDNTVSEAGLKTMLRYVFLVGGLAILAMFFIAWILAGFIISPLEENDRQQKRFISDASHELKTPVAVIATNAEMLSRELGHNEWLTNIQYETDRMDRLVKQLLDLSHAESAIVPMESLDFSRLVTGETLAFESLAFDKGKTFVTKIEEAIILRGNPSQLTQLVSILLDNAIRHSTGKEIGVSLVRRPHTALLTVTNDGNEIPAEKIHHLFERFYRVDEVRNSESNHYGIGLSIAKAIAEKHGGNIDVFWQDGKISFTVNLLLKNRKLQSYFNKPPLL